MKPFCFPVNAIQLDRTPPKVVGIIVLGVVVDVIHRVKHPRARVEDPGQSHQPVKVRGAQTALQVLVFLVPVVLFQEILPRRVVEPLAALADVKVRKLNAVSHHDPKRGIHERVRNHL